MYTFLTWDSRNDYENFEKRGVVEKSGGGNEIHAPCGKYLFFF
jgi:hypothetical protein